MALSLADELAAFDDGDQGGGLGMSLAAEFGLDIDGEDGTNGQLDDLDLDMDVGYNLGVGSIGDEVDRIDHPEQTGSLTPNRRRLSQTTNRTPKSSTYGHDTAHDETDVDAFMDDLAPGDEGEGQLVLGDFDQVGGVPSPARGQIRNRAGSVRSTIESPMKDGFLGVKADRDPLVELQEIVEGAKPFLSLLSGIDGISRSGVQEKKEKQLSLEARLQGLLERLHNEEKTREEQIRELASISRDLQTNGSILQTQQAPEGPAGLAGVAEEEEVQEDEEPGWTGDPTQTHDDSNARSDDLHADDQDRIDALLDRPAPSSPLTSHQTLPQTSPTHSLQPLPRTIHLLQSNTHDLLATLGHLSDTLHSTTSMSTSTSRQIRGIKAGVESWREREIAEDAARDAIETYERHKLEEGLRAESARENARVVLDREVREFEEVLEATQSRMEQVRREAAFRFALAR